MARREEQENARREVTEVAPDVLRMELPIHLPGLGHVNCYALIDGEGATLVDPGLPGPATWSAIRDRLKRAGLRVKNVHTIVVTHSHPDHFGGVQRLQRESGARIVAHRSFSFGPLRPLSEEPEVSVDDLSAHVHSGSREEGDHEAAQRQSASAERRKAKSEARTQGRTRSPWGGQRPAFSLGQRLVWRAMRWLGRGLSVPDITDPVKHGEALKLAGRDFFFLHTPGHTEDHICLHDPETGTLLAGDHVLPTITPHISGLGSSPDPLASFFDSLDRIGELPGVKRVLPAHGHPFSDLRGRAEAIKRHHHERLEKVKAISRELGPASVRAFSHKLFRQRSWGAMAESETYAHLEHLRLAREAECFEGKGGELIYLTD